jgi:arsenate reductase (glutaredoxin)
MKPSHITLYGIPNCDTVKKARAWLSANALDYTFHDFKKQGITKEHLAAWCAAAGTDTLLNRKGTTWRALTATEQASAESLSGAMDLMQAHTSLIKRPVVEWNNGAEQLVTVGFSATEWLKKLPAAE